MTFIVCSTRTGSPSKTSNGWAIEAIRGELIPITDHPDHLFLRAHWRFSASTTGRYLRTEWSQFGLFVWTKKKPITFIRLEVEATDNRDDWNVAHSRSTPKAVSWARFGESAKRATRGLSRICISRSVGSGIAHASKTSSSS